MNGFIGSSQSAECQAQIRQQIRTVTEMLDGILKVHNSLFQSTRDRYLRGMRDRLFSGLNMQTHDKLTNSGDRKIAGLGCSDPVDFLLSQSIENRCCDSPKS